MYHLTLMFVVRHLTMEWNDHHICVMAVGLLNAGHRVRKIFSPLCLLKITQQFVECTKPCYEERGDVVDCPRQGWPLLGCTKNVVEAVLS